MKKQNLISIGVTGLMGSGKSTALSFFREKGIRTFDLDIESKKLIKIHTKCYEEILEKFGKRILNYNGTISRRKLREVVFNDNKSRETLNKIVHPALADRILSICKNLSKRKKKMVIFEGALISRETKIGKTLSYILYVDAKKETLSSRISKRDNIQKKDARKLLIMQKSIEKNRKTADFIISNNSNLKEFDYQLNLVLDKLAY